MWWRILIPTWRFFDSIGVAPELFVREDGEWVRILKPPRLPWYALFFNPRGNYHLACMNLIERLLAEAGDAADVHALVSYKLVRDLAAGGEFKITINGEAILHSSEASV